MTVESWESALGISFVTEVSFIRTVLNRGLNACAHLCESLVAFQNGPVTSAPTQVACRRDFKDDLTMDTQISGPEMGRLQENLLGRQEGKVVTLDS